MACDISNPSIFSVQLTGTNITVNFKIYICFFDTGAVLKGHMVLLEKLNETIACDISNLSIFNVQSTDNNITVNFTIYIGCFGTGAVLKGPKVLFLRFTKV